jgi:hypothetical protein
MPWTVNSRMFWLGDSSYVWILFYRTASFKILASRPFIIILHVIRLFWHCYISEWVNGPFTWNFWKEWRFRVTDDFLLLINISALNKCEPGSSGSIVSGYGAGRPGHRSSIPGRGESIFPLSSVSRPALGPTQPPVQWVPGVLSLGLMHGRGVTLTSHPHLVPSSRMSRSYTPLPPSAFVACRGTALGFSSK